MVAHLLGGVAYMAFISGPEIAEMSGAFADSLAKRLGGSFFDGIVDRAKPQAASVASDLLDSLRGVGKLFTSGPGDAGVAFSGKMRDAIIESITESGVAVIAVEELNMLYAIASAANGQGELEPVLSAWKTRFKRI